MTEPAIERDDARDLALATDSRGAILIIGVVFGALLVGALWHVAGIGDAIAWRERAQDAADAGAFENAVWNARGMNVIVAINIVMSLVLAVLVIWRTILLLVSVALVVAAILCVVTLGTGCGFTTAVARVETFMLRNDDKVASNVLRILTAMSAAEVAVATVTPIVGMAQGSLNTHAGYDVSSAATQSASLLPAIDPKSAEKLAKCFKGKGGYQGKHRKEPTETKLDKATKAYQALMTNPRLGIGVSLPVQADSYTALCTKAGESVLNNLAGMLERMGAPGGAVEGIDKAKKFLGKVVGKLPKLFCSPLKGGAPDGLSDLVGKQAIDSCKSELEGRRVSPADTKNKDDIKYRDDDGKSVSEDEYVKSCSKKKQKEANGKLKDTFKGDEESDKKAAELTDCATPAKVWEWAVNGNVFMRSFAQVEKEQSLAQRDDRGLEVADGDRTGNVQPIERDEIVAHAEMYFECQKRWSGCKGDAAWKLGWRARLRRVQPLERLAAGALAPAFTIAADKLGKKLKIPDFVMKKVKESSYFRGARTSVVKGGLYGADALDGVGNFIMHHSDSDVTVH
jgi:hypothetical protein